MRFKRSFSQEKHLRSRELQQVHLAHWCPKETVEILKRSVLCSSFLCYCTFGKSEQSLRHYWDLYLDKGEQSEKQLFALHLIWVVSVRNNWDSNEILFAIFLSCGTQHSEAQLYRTTVWSHLWPSENYSKLWSNHLALSSSSKQTRSLFYLTLPVLHSFRCLVNARVYFYRSGNAFQFSLTTVMLALPVLFLQKKKSTFSRPLALRDVQHEMSEPLRLNDDRIVIFLVNNSFNVYDLYLIPRSRWTHRWVRPVNSSWQIWTQWVSLLFRIQRESFQQCWVLGSRIPQCSCDLSLSWHA